MDLYEIEYRRWLFFGRSMSVTLQCAKPQGEHLARLLRSKKHGVLSMQMHTGDTIQLDPVFRATRSQLDPVFRATRSHQRDKERKYILGAFYFWDETWAYAYGPFESAERARREQQMYAAQL